MAASTTLHCPFDLTVESVARLVNAELVGHDHYDGIELQWFDDPRRGTGMLAFLSRRADRRVDYYVDPTLQLDRSAYELGGGTGRWVPTDFEVARLEVDDDGVVAEVRFADLEGRTIEVEVDDRAAGRRRGADLLAPVSSGIDAPVSLLLVHLHRFDLVRRAGRGPRIRVGGRTVATGRLPGARLHRRHLVKAAAPLTVATVCRARTGPLAAMDPDAPGGVLLDGHGRGLAGVQARHGSASAALTFTPPFPPLGTLDGGGTSGAWTVTVDGAPLTGGVWHAARHGGTVELGLDVTRRWRPAPGLPPLLRVVTRVVPVFRSWPTTYRWRAAVVLDGDGATITSRWERIGRRRRTTRTDVPDGQRVSRR